MEIQIRYKSGAIIHQKDPLCKVIEFIEKMDQVESVDKVSFSLDRERIILTPIVGLDGKVIWEYVVFHNRKINGYRD